MTVLVIYEVNKDSCYYAKLWYSSSKSRAHITVVNGVCEEHIKPQSLQQQVSYTKQSHQAFIEHLSVAKYRSQVI